MHLNAPECTCPLSLNAPRFALESRMRFPFLHTAGGSDPGFVTFCLMIIFENPNVLALPLELYSSRGKQVRLETQFYEVPSSATITILSVGACFMRRRDARALADECRSRVGCRLLTQAMSNQANPSQSKAAEANPSQKTMGHISTRSTMSAKSTSRTDEHHLSKSPWCHP